MAKAWVVGVGGMGGNFARQFASGPLCSGYGTVVMDTDRKRLEKPGELQRLPLGPPGRFDTGVRGDVELGRAAALSSADDTEALLKNAERVFVVMAAGGTGAGAGPVVAETAKKAGVPFVAGLVVCPFHFEGEERLKKADGAIKDLGKCADLTLGFNNDPLYDEGVLRSIEVPPGLAEKPGERFVLGNELSGMNTRSWRANKRLAQAIRFLDEPSMCLRDKAAQGPADGVRSGKETWWGMGGGTVGLRGQFEALARALHWSIRKAPEKPTFERAVVHLLLGEDRPKDEINAVPAQLSGILGRNVEVAVRIGREPLLRQGIMVSVVGFG